MLHNTTSPTRLLAGTALNVIPSEAVARLDGRIIPGQTAASLKIEVQKRINDPHVEVLVDPVASGHESRAETELFKAIRTAMTTHDPDTMVVPYLLPALTDSRFLVSKGVTAYGFDPMRPEPGWPSRLEMAHGHDERISIANMGFGLRVLYDIIMQIAKS
jgi:acetylornithine deacetylase/succinyl-diaminopimelate desuccinylase-like protein